MAVWGEADLHQHLRSRARGSQGQLLPTLQWHLEKPPPCPDRLKGLGEPELVPFPQVAGEPSGFSLLESGRSTECSPFSFSFRLCSTGPLEEVLSIYGSFKKNIVRQMTPPSLLLSDPSFLQYLICPLATSTPHSNFLKVTRNPLVLKNAQLCLFSPPLQGMSCWSQV